MHRIQTVGNDNKDAMLECKGFQKSEDKCKLNCHKLRFSYVTSILITSSAAIFPFVSLVLSLLCVYTLLISHGAILNIKFMTSFAESNLSSCADFITLIAGHRLRRVQENRQSMTARGYCWYYLDHCSKTNQYCNKRDFKTN